MENLEINVVRSNHPELFYKKVFLKFLQNSQGNSCARAPLRTPFFIEHPWWLLLCRRQQVIEITNISPQNFQVNSTILNQLIDKIREDLPGLEVNDETEQINKHFQNTLNHIQSKKDSSDENEADIYKDFVL